MPIAIFAGLERPFAELFGVLMITILQLPLPVPLPLLLPSQLPPLEDVGAAGSAVISI